MKNYIIKLFLLTLLYSGITTAQPTEQWVNRYNSPGNLDDEGRYITVDNSGNVIVTGSSGDNIVTVKYSPAGIELWVRTHSSGSVNRVNGIVCDNSGNIIIAGSDNQTGFDFLTIKYDPAGNILWLQRYNGPANRPDYGLGLVCDANNNIYVSGRSDKSMPNTYELATVKYNSSGVLQWVNRTDAVYPIVLDMKLDTFGNIYLCGELNSTNTNAFLAKISGAGTLSFLQTYDYTPVVDEDKFESIGINSAGTEIYVTGRSWGGSAAKFDFVTIKYNSAGVSQWVQRYNGLGSGQDYPYSLVIDNSGNVYSAGQSYGGVTALRDIAIAKYSSSGIPLGFQRYSVGSNDEGAYKIRIDANQNLYLAGFNNQDVLILKYNSALTLQWFKTYNSPANSEDNSFDLILDNSGNIYVTGLSEGIGTQYDYLTIKYSQVVGINQTSNEIPKMYFLSQNFPNPFNPGTNIKFDIPNDALVNITVYDMTGREVSVIVNESMAAGRYEVSFDASHLSSGMYFYKLTAGSYTDIKKMVLIK